MMQQYNILYNICLNIFAIFLLLITSFAFGCVIGSFLWKGLSVMQFIIIIGLCFLLAHYIFFMNSKINKVLYISIIIASIIILLTTIYFCSEKESYYNMISLLFFIR